MSPETIRRIDRRLGPPLCAVLTALSRLGRLVRGPAPTGTPQRLAFLKLTEQGAILLAHPAVARARELVGAENVFFVVSDDGYDVLELIGDTPSENVLTIRTDGPARFLSDVVAFMRRMRRLRIDTVVDLEFFSRASAILALLSGGRRRVGLHRFTSEYPYRGDLMTHRVAYSPYLHVSQAYRSLVDALAAPAGQIPLLKQEPAPSACMRVPRFEASADDRRTVLSLLPGGEDSAELRSRVVLVNPNPSDVLRVRKWPEDNYLQLCKRLLDEHADVLVVLTGTAAERDRLSGLASELNNDRVVNLAGRTSLRELLALYGVGDVLVTADGGAVHFAGMTDIELVALFGPETPAIFGPLGGRATTLVAGLACSPCLSVFNHRFSPCRDNVCMQAITVDRVYAAVVSALALRPGGAGH